MHNPNEKVCSTYRKEQQVVNIVEWEDERVEHESRELSQWAGDDDINPRQRKIIERLTGLVDFELSQRIGEYEQPADLTQTESSVVH